MAASGGHAYNSPIYRQSFHNYLHSAVFMAWGWKKTDKQISLEKINTDFLPHSDGLPQDCGSPAAE